MEEINDKNLTKLTKRIFINKINSYHGKIIAKEILSLNKESVETEELEKDSIEDKEKFIVKFEIIGTNPENSKEIDSQPIDDLISLIISPNDKDFVEILLTTNIIIYDITDDFSQVLEAEKVLASLEEYYKKKSAEDTHFFILITSIMTWTNTQLNVDEDPETHFLEENYRKRRPHVCYVKHLNLEREVINAQKRNRKCLRTLVLCPGVTYGGSQDIFHYLYKMAYYNKSEIEIFQPGSNIIPIIYVYDFAKMICEIINKFPKRKVRYILAVQPETIDYFTIAQVIAKYVGGDTTRVKICPKIEMFLLDQNLMTQRVFNYCTLNLRMKPSYFSDFNFIIRDDFSSFGNKLAVEYRTSRGLFPIKVIVAGPPQSGKSNLSKALSEYYGIHLIQAENILNDTVKILIKKIKNTEAYLEYVKIGCQEKLLENEACLEQEKEVITEDNPINDEYLEGINTKLFEWHETLATLNEYIKNPEKAEKTDIEFIKKFLSERLLSKACSENQGYVLDGFPFVYEEAKVIFDDTIDAEAGEICPINIKIKPDLIVIFNGDDELFLKRTMQITEMCAVNSNNTEDEMKKRLEEYKNKNQEDVSILNYFLDRDVIPMEIKVTYETTKDELFEKVKNILGAPRVYPLSKKELDEIQRLENEIIQQEREAAERKLLKEEEEKKVKMEIQLEKWTEQFLKAKQEEQALLQVQSLPLRDYLMKYILPTLMKGLIEVCEVKPDDPIDFLAEFLFKFNPDGHMLDKQKLNN